MGNAERRTGDAVAVRTPLLRRSLALAGLEERVGDRRACDVSGTSCQTPVSRAVTTDTDPGSGLCHRGGYQLLGAQLRASLRALPVSSSTNRTPVPSHLAQIRVSPSSPWT